MNTSFWQRFGFICPSSGHNVNTGLVYIRTYMTPYDIWQYVCLGMAIVNFSGNLKLIVYQFFISTFRIKDLLKNFPDYLVLLLNVKTKYRQLCGLSCVLSAWSSSSPHSRKEALSVIVTGKNWNWKPLLFLLWKKQTAKPPKVHIHIKQCSLKLLRFFSQQSFWHWWMHWRL